MMIRRLLSVLAVLFFVTPVFAEVNTDLYSKLPLSFEPNRGQAPSNVQFLSRGNGYGLYLTETEAVLALNGSTPSVIRMHLAGQRSQTRIEALDPQPGVSNYLVGGSQTGWRDSIPHFSRVKYSGAYPGIDVVYYGSNQRQLEYDFVVAPQADPNIIRFGFSGVERLSINQEGDLVLHTAGGEILHKHPIAFQDLNGRRQQVDAEFVLYDERQVGFKLGRYDRNARLTIDPTLLWSSYLGGGMDDVGLDVAIDTTGNAYITGYTLSSEFWLVNPLQTTLNGKVDAFVTKIDKDGALAYSTYVGGSGEDEGHSLALDNAGNIYIAGYTTSTDLPIVNGFQSKFGGQLDGYVLKLNNSGSAIQYSTYLGGSLSDRVFGIAVDGVGNILVGGATSSQNFPILNALRSSFGGGLADGFVTKIGANGALAYSTFLGGLGNDQVYDIVRDADGTAVVTGFTSSQNFPTAKAIYGQFRGGDYDIFITKLSENGSSLVFSTYYGGSSTDVGVRLTVDAASKIYVTGQTGSIDFPLKNPAQILLNQDLTVSAFDAFLFKLNPDGQDVEFSTLIGGDDHDSGVAIAVDPAGYIYLGGYTESIGFYAINSVSGFLRGLRDGFVMKIAPDASHVVFSTYLGGFGIDGATSLAVDGGGNVFVTGFTVSSDFPVAANAFQAGLFGGQDGFIVKMNTDDIKTESPFLVSNDGGTSIATAGQTSVPIFGYATADLTTGIPPTGLEIVDLRSTGTLVNEVAIPLTPLMTVGRLLAKTSAGDAVAISMVNPGGDEVRVDFYFTSEGGESGDFGFFTLPGFSHLSALLNTEPFNIPIDKSGTVTFTTSLPVAVAALRVDTTTPNPVNSYVPIVDPYSANNRPVTIPHFADGQGWSTHVVLVNTGENTMDGEIRLFKNDADGKGVPAELATEQGVNSVFTYSIPPRAAKTILTRGESNDIIPGYIDVVPAEGSNTPATFANILYNSPVGGFVKTTVEAQEPASEFKMYVETSGTFGEALAATPALALANGSDTPAEVKLELTSLEGVVSELKGTITIPARGHLATFLMSVPGFENLPSPYKGVLRVTTTSPGVTFTGFRTRYNEQELFLALATGPLKDVGNLNRIIFPHLVDGGGYATQFILINGASGAGSNGLLRYFNQSGNPLNVAIEKPVTP